MEQTIEEKDSMSKGRMNYGSKRELTGDDDSRMNMERSRLLVEQENESRLMELRNKMSSLKSIVVDIDEEVKQQNRYLDDMDHDMSGVTNGMRKTLGKVGVLMSKMDQPTMAVVVLVIILVFIGIWKLVLKK